MDEVNKIRKAFFSKGKNKNEIAKEFRISWDTVNQIVSADREELKNRGKRKNRKPIVATYEVHQAVEAIIANEIEQKVRRKQRKNAKAIYQELKESGVYKGSQRNMQEIVNKIRKKCEQAPKKSFLPLGFPIGKALQVDHGEADLVINDHRFSGYLFIASVPGQVLRYCQIFPTKASESWGEFHERAFQFFGGVFQQSVYDNDSVLVKEVIGSIRKQTNFSHGLEEHYGFESHFCNLASGNEKGSVENGVGYCRRNYLSGLPKFSNWEEANNYLKDCCLREIEEGIHYKTQEPLKNLFVALQQQLDPCPPERNWRRSLEARVDSCQLITVDHRSYSVPEKYVGSYLSVSLRVFQVDIYDGIELVASHPRQYIKTESLMLDHYLDQLKYKSSAFRDCRATQQHNFPLPLTEIWGLLQNRYPNKEASRYFIEILLLGRRYSQEVLIAAVQLGLEYKVTEPAAIENILRQLTTSQSAIESDSFVLKVENLEINNWDFDLAPYVELCGGES